MRAALVAAIAVAASCSKATETSPVVGGERASAAGAAECAGVPECEKGCEGGRLEDCHQLAWFKIGARGTPIDLSGAEKLLARACAGKLVRSCGMAAWIEAGGGGDLAAARRAELDRTCRAGDGWSCAALASWALRPAAPGSRGARDTGGGATWAELGCATGHVWACATLEVVLEQVRPEPDWTPAMRERHAKLKAMIEEKRGAACAAGKREGCREGSREYEAQLRKDCAAGDHGACAELASSSQDAGEAMRAAQDACEHGKLNEACGLTCNGLRDGALGQPDMAAARACYDRVCAAGIALGCELRDAPMLGGGCRAIDLHDQPHLSLKRLPRLLGSRYGGGTFDSAGLRAKKRVFVFTASWNATGSIADLEQLAAALAPLEVDVVAVLSDASWERIQGLEGARSLTAVLDPPAAGATIGAYTSKIGISKVPEAFLVDQSGAVRRHIVGSAVLTDRLNGRRCVVEVLGAPRDRDGKQP